MQALTLQCGACRRFATQAGLIPAGSAEEEAQAEQAQGLANADPEPRGQAAQGRVLEPDFDAVASAAGELPAGSSAAAPAEAGDTGAICFSLATVDNLYIAGMLAQCSMAPGYSLHIILHEG